MSDLTDRMRTCAAAIMTEDFAQNRIFDNDAQDRIVRDAAELLVEASNLIEPIVERAIAATEAQKLHPAMSQDERTRMVGELWEMIPPKPPAKREPGPRDCPACGNQEPKRADVADRRIRLTCPQCTHQWQWRPHATWT